MLIIHNPISDGRSDNRLKQGEISSFADNSFPFFHWSFDKDLTIKNHETSLFSWISPYAAYACDIQGPLAPRKLKDLGQLNV